MTFFKILVANIPLFREKLTINYLQKLLQPVLESGIWVEGSVFSLDEEVYLNLKLLLTNGNEYVIEYEPALVSSKSLTKYIGN